MTEHAYRIRGTFSNFTKFYHIYVYFCIVNKKTDTFKCNNIIHTRYTRTYVKSDY